jgi:hypothetical protein
MVYMDICSDDANKARKEMVLDIIRRREFIPPELKELIVFKIVDGWVHRLETLSDISRMEISVQVIKAVTIKAKENKIYPYTADLMVLNALPLDDSDLIPEAALDVRETLSLLRRYLHFRIERESTKLSLREVLEEYKDIEPPG